MTLPLAEALRPGRLTDICGQQQVVETLLALEKKLLRPHLLLHGQPGIGKSTILRCLEQQSTNLVIRECDDRSTENMRTRMKHFISMSSLLPKLITVEAVDKMTKCCQGTLRDIMDLHTVQVVLTTRDVANVLPALVSRCLKLSMQRIPVDDICSQLEKLDHNEIAQPVSQACDGDLRAAIHIQQTNSLNQDMSAETLELVCKRGRSAVRNWVIEHTVL